MGRDESLPSRDGVGTELSPPASNAAPRADRYQGIDRYLRAIDSPAHIWSDRICVLCIAFDTTIRPFRVDVSQAALDDFDGAHNLHTHSNLDRIR